MSIDLNAHLMAAQQVIITGTATCTVPGTGTESPPPQEGTKLEVIGKDGETVEVVVVGSGDRIDEVVEKINASNNIRVKNVGTVGHVDSGKRTLIAGLSESVSRNMTDSLRRLEVINAGYLEAPPVRYDTDRRTRTRGDKPSPAQRLLLLQQERRKRG